MINEWIRANDALIGWMVLASIVTFAGSLVLVPWLIVQFPADYFSHRKRHHLPWADQHPLVRLCLLAVKNLLGTVFVLVGITMLVLPGQGVLTILAGIMLLDFPGKYRLERWVISRRPVLRSVNWLRRRAGQAPFDVDGDGD